MLLEVLIMLEVIAFIFLALGIMPNSKSMDLEGNESKPPYMNKMIFIIVSGILFFMLSPLTMSYDYNYCYVNQTTADFTLNQSISTATCASYNIESIGLVYLNLGMGLIAVTLATIIGLFAGTSKHDLG